MSKEYMDYDLQTSVDTKNAVKLQIVGMTDDGKKDILKEFNDKVSFAGFSPKTNFRATDEKPKGSGNGLKIAGAFTLGLVTGGTVVFFVMRSKYEKELKELRALLPPEQYSAPPPQPQRRQAYPDDDLSQWISDYDDDIFARD